MQNVGLAVQERCVSDSRISAPGKQESKTGEEAEGTGWVRKQLTYGDYAPRADT